MQKRHSCPLGNPTYGGVLEILLVKTEEAYSQATLHCCIGNWVVQYVGGGVILLCLGVVF